MNGMELVTLQEGEIGRLPQLCGHSPRYRKGYDAKQEWLAARFREGLRYTLVRVNGANAGVAEVLPAEHAWRPVEAAGYLFIHCFWIVGRNRGHGYGRTLLQDILDQARGTNGVVVLVSRNHWLPTPRLFLKNGFEPAGRMEPGFDLLVRRLQPGAPLPRLRSNPVPSSPGLTLYHSDQCPYTQNVAEIVESVGARLRIPVQRVHLDSAQEAQAAPCPYGTLGYFYNGELLTHRPCGADKLQALLAQKQAGSAG